MLVLYPGELMVMLALYPGKLMVMLAPYPGELMVMLALCKLRVIQELTEHLTTIETVERLAKSLPILLMIIAENIFRKVNILTGMCPALVVN